MAEERMRDENGTILPNGGKTTARISIVEMVIGTREYEETIVEQAEAVCSLKDTYSKRIGRTITLGRLKKKLGVKTDG